MTPHHAALTATAGGLLLWNTRTSHDPTTGAPTTPQQGGHARAALGARAIYPRIDPAVIVLVVCGDWVLLGRKAAWEVGRYSCLAGFCEVGETLEQAVVREVREESGVGVDVGRVVYHSSQPWPFPSSLMVGFVAHAVVEEGTGVRKEEGTGGNGVKGVHGSRGTHTTTSCSSSSSTVGDTSAGLQGYAWLGGSNAQGTEAARSVGVTAQEVHAVFHSAHRLPSISRDDEELEDVRWFHREYLLDMVLGGGGMSSGGQLTAQGSQQEGVFRIPQQYALANRIITSWLMQPSQMHAVQHPETPKMPSTQGISNEGAVHPPPAAAHPPPAGLDAVPTVRIDIGVFKYVLARVVDTKCGVSKLVVRGDVRAGYHDNLLQHLKKEAHVHGFKVGCGFWRWVCEWGL